MIWGAHKADGRIAAKNSVKIRAALRASIDAQRIFEDYQHTHPYASDDITQDRARARAWAMLHVQTNKEPMKAVLVKVYADGFALGQVSADEALARAKEMRKAGDVYVDWQHWKPGNRAAALILRPTGAFKRLLDQAGIVSDNLAKVGYDRIGTALADSIAAGFSPQRAAKVITEKIGDPARALTIAITEQNRAISAATIERYSNAGLEQVEWTTSDPCDECEPNDGQIVAIGEDFNSGDSEPPVHPNCRCALLPVISGMQDDTSLGQDFIDSAMYD
jgi:SPP1 gp7 family putative phage head morphogenesis protein